MTRNHTANAETALARAISALDVANDVMKNLGIVVLTAGNALRVAMVRYDPATLAWVPYTGTEISVESLTVEVNTDDLEASVRPPTGTGDNGTVTLAAASAATQVPDAGNVPASAYVLVLSNQAANNMNWGYKTDDNTGGTFLKKTSGTATMQLGANQSVEVWGTLNDVVNWTTKII